MYLKDLRKMSDETIVELLNDSQKWYNKWFDIWKYTKSVSESKRLDRYEKTISNCKRVLLERNLKVEFTYKGWEVIQ